MSDEPTPPSSPPTPPPAAAKPSAKPAKAKRPRRRHGWLFRGFVALLVLLVLLTAALFGVQWALQNTEYARNIAIPIVERELGLRIHAGGLKVSLFGHTELTDVTAGLPLDDQDFLKVKQLRVKHSNLLQIILSRTVGLGEITVDHPTVYVVKDRYGQWNLLRAVDILGRLGGSNSSGANAGGGGSGGGGGGAIPQLPAIRLIDGIIDVDAGDDGHGHHRRAEVRPLNVNGRPDGQLTFRYDLTAGLHGAEQLNITGVVAPGGDWVHHVTVAVGHLDGLARAFGAPSAYNAAVAGQWDGKLTDGKVGGRLTLQNVSARAVPGAGDVNVTGAVDVATGGAATPAVGGAAGPAPVVTLTPSNLLIESSVPTIRELGVTTGTLVYDAAGVHARNLNVKALGGVASLDLSADPKTQNVDLAAHWSGLTLKAGISQDGSLTASVRQPYPGQPLIRVELDDRGSIGSATATAGGKPGTRWDVGATVTGQGTSWQSVDWVLGVPRLRVDSGTSTYDLSGITAAVQQRPTTIDLLGLTLPSRSGGPSAAAAVTAAVAGRNGGASTPLPTAATMADSRATVPGTGGNPAAVPDGGSPLGLSFSASAHVDLPDRANPDPAKRRPLNWTASASGGVLASYQGSPLPVTLTVDANGNDQLYTLKRFQVSAADADLRADGTYDRSKPKPVALHVRLTQAQRAAVLQADAPIQGSFSGEFDLVGVLFEPDPLTDPVLNPAGTTLAPNTAAGATTYPTTVPSTGPATTNPVSGDASAPSVAMTAGAYRKVRPYLTTTGTLDATDLVVFGRTVGNIAIKLNGDVRSPHPPKTANGPEAADDDVLPARVHVGVHSSEFLLLQSPWKLAVEYPNEAGAAQVDLSTHDLSLDVLAKAAMPGQDSPVHGDLASAHWRLTASGLGPDKIDLDSEYKLTGLQAAGVTVDSVDAAASYHDGVAKLDPVVARSGTGRTDLSVLYNLASPTRVHAHVKVADWPYPLMNALGGTTEARANADVDAGYDFKLKGAVATATAGVDVLLHPAGSAKATQTLAHAQVTADVRGRTINLTDVSGRVLNGTFAGAGQADVGRPLEAVGQLKWQNVDVGTLGAITGAKVLDDLGGVFDGAVTVAPSRDPRPLEPVRIDVMVASRDAHFRTVRLGTPDRVLMTKAVAYAGMDATDAAHPDKTGFRFVLDHSDIYAAGGVVHVWGRVGTTLGTQAAIVEYRGLSLDQLTHVVPAQVDGPVPGTLSGELRVIRTGSGLNGINGGGNAILLDADLIHIKAIGNLYNLLPGNKNSNPQPIGTGGTDLAIEAGTVRVNGLRFYNRGVDVKGLLSVGPIDLSDLDSAPLGGQVVGTLRSAKNSRLPFLSDFDKNFSVLQGSFSAVNIGGTLGHPTISPAAGTDIGTGLRELIVGDAQKQSDNGGN